MIGTCKIRDTLSYGALLLATDFTDFAPRGFRELRTCVQRQVGLIFAVSAACSPLLVSIFNLCPPPACREQRHFARPISAYVTSQVQPKWSSISKGSY